MQGYHRLATAIAITLLSALPSGDSRAQAKVDAAGGALTVTLQDRELVVVQGQARQAVALPCAGKKHLVHGDAIYVACGGDGAVLVPLKAGVPQPPRHLAIDGDVTGFFAAEGRVWALVSRQEARPVDLSAAREPGAQPGAAAGIAPAATHTGKPGVITGVAGGRATVSIGSDDGVKVDQRMELYREVTLTLGDGQEAVREETLAVGRVAAVSGRMAQVDLGVNEQASAGTKARPTTRELSANRLIPPRVGEVWDVAFMLRPFLGLGTFGVGMVSDAAVGYRFLEPWHVQLLAQPLGMGLSDGGNIVAEAGNIVGSYDTVYFEIGLGLGWSAVNSPLDISRSTIAYDSMGASVPRFEKVRDGLSIAQVARLGSLDGIHLSAHNFFVYYKSEFQYGGTIGALQTPITDRSWLVMRGGGGVAGYWFGEIGLRVLVRGNGGPGSLFLSPSLGGAGLFGEKEGSCQVYDPRTGGQTTVPCAQEVSYGGPMVGFGMEWRI